MHLYRGQSGNSGSIAFRVWYNKIQELRSLLPSNTPFVALTATAMKSTREKICNALNMRSPEFIMVSPERINISYAVVKMSNQVNVIEYFDWLLCMLKSNGIQCDRTIIYCQTVNQCSTLFSIFSAILGSKIYIHNDKPNPKERLLEMMHARTPDSVKEIVLNSMADNNGHIRVLICTIAFGMGVDAKGVRNIINFGPSRNLESYVQESGRCSRDGEQGRCVILYLGRMLTMVSKDMRDYVMTQACRREDINKHFDIPVVRNSNMQKPVGHYCCDNCAMYCNCVEGGCKYKTICSVNQLQQESRIHVRIISPQQNASLQKALVTYKKTWVSYCMHKNLQGESKFSAISCPSFLMEFGDYHIKQVMNNAPYILSMKDIYKHIEIWRLKHAIEIYKILKGIFPEMQNELLPDIPEDEVDIFEDEDDEDDNWMRLFNESFNTSFGSDMFIDADESMYVDESIDFDRSMDVDIH